MFKLPPFLDLAANFPTQTSPDAVKKAIGGRVNAAWITNTCAIKLSAALNGCGSGHQIPAPGNAYGLGVVSGADGRWYAYRVSEMSSFLALRYGPPLSMKGTPQGMLAKLAGRTGIIRFDVAGWNDATGHLDLWNGSACAKSCYFLSGPRVKTRSVSLWAC